MDLGAEPPRIKLCLGVAVLDEIYISDNKAHVRLLPSDV